MNCPHCHTEIDPGAVFCGNCGQALTAQPIANSPTVSTPTVVTPSSRLSSAEPATTPSQPNISAPIQTSLPASSTINPTVQAAQPTTIPNSGTLSASPAYADPLLMHKKGSGLATASMILGILGLIGWLFAIVGLIMGILALIFGTISLKSSRRGFAIAGTILSVPVIGLSIFSGIWGYQNYLKEQKSGTKTSTASKAIVITASADEQIVSTTCYDVKLPKLLEIKHNNDNCSVEAIDAKSGSDYVIVGITVKPSQIADLKGTSGPDIQNFLKSTPGSSIVSEDHTTFKEDKAYHYVLTSGGGWNGDAVYVAHQSKTDNLFIFMHLENKGEASLSSLEQGIVWK